MITIYMVDVPEFHPLIEDARKRPECRVKRFRFILASETSARR